MKNLHLFNAQVHLLTPIGKCPLEIVWLESTGPADLNVFKGMASLKVLKLNNVGISGLHPLAGLPLKELEIRGCLQVDDLTPLQWLRLEKLVVEKTKVSDLTPLAKMKLTYLDCSNSEVADLAPLQGMPIEFLRIGDTKVTDLSPLKGMPLVEVALDAPPGRILDVLRGIKSLQTINGLPVAEFWKVFGAAKTESLPPGSGTFKNTLGMEFVLVPKGTGWLGGGGGKVGDKEVTIDHDFYMGKYEVTQEEWFKVMKNNPSAFSRTGSEAQKVAKLPDDELKHFPVECISWVDAQAFISALNETVKNPKWVYRLPKEAEWEYGCRGGPAPNKAEFGFHFYFDRPSNELDIKQAAIRKDGTEVRAHKVGSFPPNRLGLHDMHGNVWEWCDDPEVITKGKSFRVVRGGCWSDGAEGCRASSAGTGTPGFRTPGIGFRMALVPVGNSADSDRKAAEYVLSIDGTVRVNDEDRDIKVAVDLPRDPFRLTVVSFYDNPRLTNEGLAVFKDCKHIKFLDLWKANVTLAVGKPFANCMDLQMLYLGESKVTDAGLEQFKNCKTLVVIDLQGTEITETGLAYFKSNAKLETLNLAGSKTRDAGLAYFQDCYQLTKLLLWKTDIGDPGLAYLKDCKSLVHLNLSDNRRFTDVGLANFKDCANLEFLHLLNTNVSDQGVSHFKNCKKLKHLNLFNTPQVSDSGVAQFQGCVDLELLNLFATNVSDVGMAAFKDCNKLVFLNISKTKVSDTGVRWFKDCKNLEVLWLNQLPVTNETLAEFKNCWALKDVALQKTQVTDQGLATLASFPNLTRIFLWHTKVTDDGVAYLGKRKNLEILQLSHTLATDKGVAHLKDCRELRELHLSETIVSDACIPVLTALKNLKFLPIAKTRISAVGFADLKKALPNCKIDRDDPVK